MSDTLREILLLITTSGASFAAGFVCGRLAALSGLARR